MISASPQYETSTKKLMSFLRRNQIVMESASINGVPSLVKFMAGHDFTGNWWSLPQSSRIYNALQRIRNHPDILVCRLLRGRICLVHRFVWAPLLALSSRFSAGALDRVIESHGESGRHSVTVIETPDWAPPSVNGDAAELTSERARAKLFDLIPHAEAVLRILKT